MAGGKIQKKCHDTGVGGGARLQGGIPFKKSKGHHILRNPALVDSIVAKAGLKPTDTVLEIGLGTGNLTKRLLEAGVKAIIAVKLDPRMVLEHRRFQGHPLSSHLKVSAM
jgi:18S rRNA (adenine1779-N6/adenine1780-N6)-dimethyltransferase